MKTLFISVLLSLVAMAVPMSRGAAATPPALRQVLADAPGVGAVYVVDRNHTFVMGSLPLQGESKAFHVLGRYYGGPGHTLQATMIEHGEEPMIYKSAATGTLGALRSGSVRLSHEPLSSGKDGYSSLDIFEMATLSCQNGGGHPLYVIPKKYGRFKRLTEVAALDAFRYILLKGSTSVWFVACNGKGAARFQVLKNYDFINDGEEVAEFRQGLALDDVDYVRDERAEAVRLADLQKRRSVSATSLEATAREIAALKRGFVKNIAGKRYYGSYRGDGDGGCAAVSLRRIGSDEDVRVTVVHDYRVCSGKVSLLGLSETEESVARKAIYYSRGGLKVANSD